MGRLMAFEDLARRGRPGGSVCGSAPTGCPHITLHSRPAAAST